MILEIAYDLHNPGRDYDAVERVIKKAGSWAHPQGSVWLVDTLTSCSALRDALKAAADPNDEFLVVRLAPRDWASSNMDKDVVAWLKDSARRW